MNSKNMIVILADEHSRRYAGCYGDPVVKTPNIDKLAAGGTLFSRAYTPSPMCISARASLATGQWVHQTGYTDSIAAYDGAIPSWGHRLIEEGHQVVSFGKVAYRDNSPTNGFSDQFLPIHNVNGLGWTGGLLREPVYVPEDDFEEREFARHVGVGDSDYTKYDRLVCETACAWLRTHGNNQERPWVMFVSLISPHYPLIAPQEFYDLYTDESVALPHGQGDIPSHPIMKEHRKSFDYNRYFDDELTIKARRAYYGLCSFTDFLVGQVVSTMEVQGLSDDTRILYTSDHGEMLGNHGIWTKMCMYEDSVAVPMILSGSGVPSRKVVDTPVSLVDCYPTIVEGAGITLSKEEKSLPGVSLFAMAEGEKPKRWVISEYHDGGMSTGTFMLVKDQWKYIYYPGYNPQLYNMVDDPSEDNDLFHEPACAQVLQECEAALREILDPEVVNEKVLSKQAAQVEDLGGYDSVKNMGESNMFIELDALYVNSEEMRVPVEENVRRK